MVWVRSEYANELAVACAWLAMLLPWNVTVARLGGIGTMVFVRFPIVHVQYLYGFPTVEGASLRQAGVALTDSVYLADPYSARAYYLGLDEVGIATAALVWGIGATGVLLAFGLSALTYVDENRVAELVDPARTMGLLLGASAVVLTAATYLFWTRFPGVSIPVGVLFLYVFAAVLLAADRS